MVVYSNKYFEFVSSCQRFLSKCHKENVWNAHIDKYFVLIIVFTFAIQ